MAAQVIVDRSAEASVQSLARIAEPVFGLSSRVRCRLSVVPTDLAIEGMQTKVVMAFEQILCRADTLAIRANVQRCAPGSRSTTSDKQGEEKREHEN